MFKNYFKTAFRNLIRNKVYSFINIAGLSLGLACVMLIILYLKDEVNWQLFALAGSLVIFIALLTVRFQAIKTALANPVKSLRTE